MAASPESISSGQKENWVDNPQLIAELKQLIQTLLVQTNGHHVLALGQSAAWVVTAAKMKDQSFSYQHVAMSKALFITYRPPEGGFMAEEISFVQNKEVTSAQIKGFRKYLSQNGITPEIILGRFNNGQKTIIFDFIGSGAGVATFAYVLKSWAAEKGVNIDPALVFLGAMKSYNTFSSCPLIFRIVEQEEFNRICHKIHGEGIKITRLMFEELGSSIDEGPFQNRLVPAYPSTAWQHFPQTISYEQGAIKYISETLQQTMQSNSNPVPEVLMNSSNIPEDIPADVPTNIHRNKFGMFSPANIARNISAGVAWDSTTSYREYCKRCNLPGNG